jgi:hypothetical protein
MVSCRLEIKKQEWKNPACEIFIIGGMFFQKVTIHSALLQMNMRAAGSLLQKS